MKNYKNYIKREDFTKVIKALSFWEIDKRKGDYKLPDGEKLSRYIKEVVCKELEINSLAISDDGNLYPYIDGNYDVENHKFNDYILLHNEPIYNEVCDYEKQEKRIDALIREVIGY